MSGPNRASAAFAVSASTTTWPSCERRSESVQRISGSSSTTRIVAGHPDLLLRRGPRGADQADDPGDVERLRDRVEGAGASSPRASSSGVPWAVMTITRQPGARRRTRRSSPRSSESGRRTSSSATAMPAVRRRPATQRLARADPASSDGVAGALQALAHGPADQRLVVNDQDRRACEESPCPTRTISPPRALQALGR